MHFIHQIERLQKLNKLIEQEKTGTPEEFARRLGIQRRTLYDLIESIKSLGVEIKYDRKSQTFQYDSAQKIDIKFSLQIISEGEIRKISGGSSNCLLPCIFSAQNGHILDLSFK